MTRARDSKLQRWGERAIAAAAESAARRLPRRVVHRLGNAAGGLAWAAMGARRRIAHDNLAAAGYARPERRRIARRCFTKAGRNAFDLLTFDRYGLDDIGDRIRVEGFDHLERAHEEGRGVLVVTGHLGHWELTALLQGHLGRPMALLHRPLDNPAVDERLSRLRRLSGNEPVSKRQGLLGIVRVLRRGGIVAFVFDQGAKEDAADLPLFGRPARTTLVPARLALRTGARIVPTFCRTLPGGRYAITYEAPLTLPRIDGRDATIEEAANNADERIDEDRAACATMQSLNDWLERRVREAPDEWFWMHRRWKHTLAPDRVEGDVGDEAAERTGVGVASDETASGATASGATAATRAPSSRGGP